MRRSFVAVVVALLVAAPAAALAAGPSGSTEKDNQVTCGQSTVSEGDLHVFAGETPEGGQGIEVCNQGAGQPQGRAMVGDGTGTEGHGGPFAAVDGDADNTSYNATGHILIDEGGVSCEGEDPDAVRDAGTIPPNCQP